MVWFGMVWYGWVWFGMEWYGMVWYGMVWYGIVWYGIVLYSIVLYWILFYFNCFFHYSTYFLTNEIEKLASLIEKTKSDTKKVDKIIEDIKKKLNSNKYMD